MMSEQNRQEKIRRWIIPKGRRGRRLLVAAGRHRNGCIPIIIKALDNLSQHLTFALKDDGTFNLHLTKEGNVHKQTKLAEGRINTERLKGKVEAIYQKSIKSINPRAKWFRNFIVLSPRNSESWNEFYWRLYEYKGRKMIYPDSAKLKEMEPSIQDYFDILYFDELPESSDFSSLPFGIYSNVMNDRFGALFSDGKNYYMIPISEMIEALGASFTVESIFCPRCEAKMRPSTRLCPSCGKKFS